MQKKNLDFLFLIFIEYLIMSENELVIASDDSVWGRITLLVRSLMGEAYTPKHRAQFYEILLTKSLDNRGFEVII